MENRQSGIRRYKTLLLQEAVKKGTVFQEERPKFFRNGKNTMAMLDIYDFKGHRSSPVDGVHVAASGAKAGMAAKGNVFEIPTARASKHGTTKGRIAAMNHFLNIFDNRVTRMLKIKHFFKMVEKNIL